MDSSDRQIADFAIASCAIARIPVRYVRPARHAVGLHTESQLAVGVGNRQEAGYWQAATGNAGRTSMTQVA